MHLQRLRKEQGLQEKSGASQRKCPKADYNGGTKQGGGKYKWSVKEGKIKVFQERGPSYYVVAVVESSKVAIIADSFKDGLCQFLLSHVHVLLLITNRWTLISHPLNQGWLY